MKDGQLFRVKVIKDESDLPKEVGDYFVKLINGNGTILHYTFIDDVGFNVDKFNWLDTVELYLIPEPGYLVPEPEIETKIDINQPFFGNSGARPDVSDADIEAWTGKIDRAFTHHSIYCTGLIEGAKSMRDGEIKKIEK